jgi:TrmH family RNA methyltransferase
VEGPHAVGDALAAGVEIVRVFHTPDDGQGALVAERSGAEALVVAPEVLARVSTTQTPQSPVAVVAIPDTALPSTGDVLVAWGVGDPGNVGTLIRTAAAFGLWFAAGPGCADPWSPKVLRSAAGGHFRTVVCEVADLGGLGDRIVAATVPSGGSPPSELPGGPVAVLVGDESSGLPGDVVAQAGARVTIPMPGGTESLNAAVAGAIVAYEASRRGGAGSITAKH